MLRYEREVLRLRQRTESAEHQDLLGAAREHRGILRDAMPDMTDEERIALQEMDLRTHQSGAEMLAERGRPVPGNDPGKPN